MSRTLRIATSEEDLSGHHLVRHKVFVDEQRIFTDTDIDEWDIGAHRIVAEVDGQIVGAVRIYRLDNFGLWKGDRLAVLPEARRAIGMLLVRFAVETAGLRGGLLMVANVQQANIRFFQRLGWTTQGPLIDYHGRPHQEVSTPLVGAVPVEAHYEALAWVAG